MKIKYLALIITVLFFSISIYASGQNPEDSIKVAREMPVLIDQTDEADEEETLSQRINDAFVPIVDGLGSVLFYDPFSSIGLFDPVIYDENDVPV